VPVTVKFRKGIDDALLTFLDAGAVAEAEGARAVALHARTAAQLYSGEADWSAIAEPQAGRQVDPGARQRRRVRGPSTPCG
jgi:tRNA-dihydrouridine synthase